MNSTKTKDFLQGVTTVALVLLTLIVGLSYFGNVLSAKDSYYNGVYDACLVITSKFPPGGFMDGYCEKLTENAKAVDAFKNRVPERLLPNIEGNDL